MTLSEFVAVIEEKAMESVGTVDEIEFVICQQGPFELSDGTAIDKKYMAFSPDEDHIVPLFCDTIDELLDRFMINEKPLRVLLDHITDFSASSCTA